MDEKVRSMIADFVNRVHDGKAQDARAKLKEIIDFKHGDYIEKQSALAVPQTERKTV
jgi:hypothetical protein